jgi:hypothetical protein
MNRRTITNKKAQAGTLQTLIIGSVVFIILAVVIVGIFVIVKSGSNIEKCRASILIANTAQAGGKTFTTTDCPRIDTNVKTDDVTDPNFGDNIQPYLLQNEMAEALRTCWYKTGEGKLNGFNENLLLGTKSSCIICGEVKFDQAVQDNYVTPRATQNAKAVGGFLEYLGETKIKNTNLTYLQYFHTDSETDTSRLFAYNKVSDAWYSSDMFDVTKSYFIVFQIVTPDYIDQKLRWLCPTTDNLVDITGPLPSKWYSSNQCNYIPQKIGGKYAARVFAMNVEDIQYIGCDVMFQ